MCRVQRRTVIAIVVTQCPKPSLLDAMLKQTLTLLLACGCFTVSNLKLHAAAVDYFLKIDGIDGESQAIQHPGEINVLNFSWGVSNPSAISGGGSGQTAGVPKFSDILITLSLDKSSPKLMLACAQGKHIPTVTLTGSLSISGKPTDYYQITLTDCVISSFQTGGSSDGGNPTQSISVSYATIEYSYTPQKPDGTLGTPIKSTWDLTKNTGQ